MCHSTTVPVMTDDDNDVRAVEEVWAQRVVIGSSLKTSCAGGGLSLGRNHLPDPGIRLPFGSGGSGLPSDTLTLHTVTLSSPPPTPHQGPGPALCAETLKGPLWMNSFRGPLYVTRWEAPRRSPPPPPHQTNVVNCPGGVGFCLRLKGVAVDYPDRAGYFGRGSGS